MYVHDRLQEPVSQKQVHFVHGRVRRRQDGKYQESDPVPGVCGRVETKRRHGFIHDASKDEVGVQLFVALKEFLEGNAVGETLAANADAFQDTVAAQLVQHQRSLDLAGPFLVIGDDATGEIWVRVAQSGHELRQLMFIDQQNGWELALGRAERCVYRGLLAHVGNSPFFPDLDDKRILGRLQQLDSRRWR